MSDSREAIPARFERALLSLREPRLRREVHLEEVPAPSRLAPFTAALTAEITTSPGDLDPDGFLGHGRFVILHDPEGQPAWDGDFRVVVLARAALDPEMGQDPLLGEVGWSWLYESLTNHRAGFHHLSGTVTRVLSESFGGLDLTSGEVEIEVRASWTPTSEEIGEHLAAWAELACTVAGLEPVPSDVTSLGRRR
ncbi:Uncharacterized protein Q1 colocalized with Q [Actinomycetales bacterium JB111]|nr:Uncharacterized protein Q1 colocalized with Q [Actinomycetales bacterium JB111]